MELNFTFHPAQKIIYESQARFKVVAAGRRFGKSYLAAMLMIMYAIQDTHKGTSGKIYDVASKPVYYIGPTFEQAKRIMWDLVQTLGRPLIAKTHENSATITLINGRKIIIKGSDDPDSRHEARRSAGRARRGRPGLAATGWPGRRLRQVPCPGHLPYPRPERPCRRSRRAAARG